MAPPMRCALLQPRQPGLPPGGRLPHWHSGPPLYVEAFASDVLGARLWGKAGGEAPPVTLAHLDETAVLVVRPGFDLHVLAGWGGQPVADGAWGAVAGVGADALTPTLDMKLRL